MEEVVRPRCHVNTNETSEGIGFNSSMIVRVARLVDDPFESEDFSASRRCE